MKRIFCLSVFLFAGPANAAPVTYTFETSTYETVSGPYTTDMRITGTLVVDGPLTEGSYTSYTTPFLPILDWSYSDGVNVYDAGNAYNSLDIEVDASGAITYWNISSRYFEYDHVNPYGPWEGAVGDSVASLYITSRDGLSDRGITRVCSASENGTCTESYGPGGSGGVSKPEIGVWTIAVPIPAAVWLFGSALAGLGWTRRTQSA